MSDINIHDITIGIYTKGLTVLIALLTKASAHPSAPSFPSLRLAPDMLPLSFHVQSACNTACKSLQRLGVGDIPSQTDEETTLEELIARVEATLGVVRPVKEASMEGMEEKRVGMAGGQISGKQFVLGFAVPNFFFHLQTVYALLRMGGVGLGKADYLTPWGGAWDRDGGEGVN